MTTDDGLAREAPQTPGALLRAAREARGLSVDEIAGRLRLKPPLVEALERDDLAALGAGPYGRGQLRNYARLVGVDEARVVQPLTSARGVPAGAPPARSGLRRPSLARQPRSRWPVRLLTAGVLGIVAILSVLWGYGTGPDRSEPSAPAPTPPLTAQPPIPPAPRPAAVASSPPPATRPSAPGTATPSAAAPYGAQTPITIPGLPPVASVPDGSGAPAPPAPAPSAELVLAFTAPCWVEVTDQTGARLLYRMAREGDRHVLRGSTPFTVTLGNAGAVQLTYNGAPFAKPEINRPVARLRVGG